MLPRIQRGRDDGDRFHPQEIAEYSDVRRQKIGSKSCRFICIMKYPLSKWQTLKTYIPLPFLNG